MHRRRRTKRLATRLRGGRGWRRMEAEACGAADADRLAELRSERQSGCAVPEYPAGREGLALRFGELRSNENYCQLKDATGASRTKKKPALRPVPVELVRVGAQTLMFMMSW